MERLLYYRQPYRHLPFCTGLALEYRHRTRKIAVGWEGLRIAASSVYSFENWTSSPSAWCHLSPGGEEVAGSNPVAPIVVGGRKGAGEQSIRRAGGRGGAAAGIGAHRVGQCVHLRSAVRLFSCLVRGRMAFMCESFQVYRKIVVSRFNPTGAADPALAAERGRLCSTAETR